MAGLYSILNTGKVALNANQIAVNTVSHNISNVNTPGYSKQRAILENRDPFRIRQGQLGQGVDVLTIDRMNGRYIHRQIVDKNNELGYFERSYSLLQEAEMIFHDQEGADIQNGIISFFDSFKTLSTRPDDVALRENVRQQANVMIDRFHRVDGELDRMQREINPELDGRVKEVNRLTEEIAKLNKEIAAQEFAGHQANDLRDRQDEKVRELAKIIKVNSFEDNKGFLNVWIDSGEPLVTGKEHYDLVTVDPGTGLKGVAVDRKGVYVDITDDLRGGELAALIDVRDVQIEGYRDRLNELANTLSTEINNVHSSGFGLNLNQGNFFDTSNPPDPIDASNISLHINIVNDLDNIAAGQINDPDSIYGDNRNAIAISDLLKNDSFFGNDETFANHYQQTVSLVGHDVLTTEGKLNYVIEEETQLNNFREKLVGVNMDEELVDLNKFQKAYEACSRIIQTAETMLDTLLSLKQG